MRYTVGTICYIGQKQLGKGVISEILITTLGQPEKSLTSQKTAHIIKYKWSKYWTLTPSACSTSNFDFKPWVQKSWKPHIVLWRFALAKKVSPK